MEELPVKTKTSELEGLRNAHVFGPEGGRVTMAVCKRTGLAVCVPCGYAIKYCSLETHLKNNHKITQKKHKTNLQGFKCLIATDEAKIVEEERENCVPFAWTTTLPMFECKFCPTKCRNLPQLRTHFVKEHKGKVGVPKGLSIIARHHAPVQCQTLFQAKGLKRFFKVRESLNSQIHQGLSKAEVEIAEQGLIDISPLRHGKADSSVQPTDNQRNISEFCKLTKLHLRQNEANVTESQAFFLGRAGPGEQEGEKDLAKICKSIIKKEMELIAEAPDTRIGILSTTPNCNADQDAKRINTSKTGVTMETYSRYIAQIVIFVCRVYKERKGIGKAFWEPFKRFHIKRSIRDLLKLPEEVPNETKKERNSRVGASMWKVLRVVVFDPSHCEESLTTFWGFVVCQATKMVDGQCSWALVGDHFSSRVAAARYGLCLVGNMLLRTRAIGKDEIIAILKDPCSPHSAYRTILHANQLTRDADNRAVKFHQCHDHSDGRICGIVNRVEMDLCSYGESTKKLATDIMADMEKLCAGMVQYGGSSSSNLGGLDWSLVDDIHSLKALDESPRHISDILDQSGRYFIDSIRDDNIRTRINAIRSRAVTFAVRLHEEAQTDNEAVRRDRAWLIDCQKVTAKILCVLNHSCGGSCRQSEMTAIKYKTGRLGTRRSISFHGGVMAIKMTFGKSGVTDTTRCADIASGKMFVMFALTCLPVREKLREMGIVVKQENINGPGSDEAGIFVGSYSKEGQKYLGTLMSNYCRKFYALGPADLRHMVIGLFRILGQRDVAAQDIVRCLQSSSKSEEEDLEADTETVRSVLANQRAHSIITEDRRYAHQGMSVDHLNSFDKGKVTSGYFHMAVGLHSDCAQPLQTGFMSRQSEYGQPQDLAKIPTMTHPSLSIGQNPARKLSFSNNQESIPSVDIAARFPRTSSPLPESEHGLPESKCQPPQVSVDRSVSVAAEAILKTTTMRWKSAQQHEAARFCASHRVGQIFQAQDALVILPTGGGKSLVYQICMQLDKNLPRAILLVLPYKALTQQVLRQLRGLSFELVVISQISQDGMSSGTIQRKIEAGLVDGIIVSCENLTDELNVNIIHNLCQRGLLSAIFIDEGHTIASEISFRRGNAFLKSTLRPFECENEFVPSIFALSATVSPSDELHVVQACGMDHSNTKIIRTSTNRPNACYKVYFAKRLDDSAVMSWIGTEAKAWSRSVSNGHVIIFFSYISQLEKVFEMLEIDNDFLTSNSGFFLQRYHGNMTEKDRMHAISVLSGLQSGKSGTRYTILATIGFGAGIDIPSIRKVLVVGSNWEMREVCQMFGRGGRDDLPYDAQILLGNTGSDFKNSKLPLFEAGPAHCIRKRILISSDGVERSFVCRPDLDQKCGNCSQLRSDKGSGLTCAQSGLISSAARSMMKVRNAEKMTLDELQVIQSRLKNNSIGQFCPYCFVKGKRGSQLSHPTQVGVCDQGMCFDCLEPCSSKHNIDNCPVRKDRREGRNSLPRCYWCGLNRYKENELHSSDEFGNRDLCPFVSTVRWCHALKSSAQSCNESARKLNFAGIPEKCDEGVVFDRWLSGVIEKEAKSLPLVRVIDQIFRNDQCLVVSHSPSSSRLSSSWEVLRSFKICAFCYANNKTSIDHYPSKDCARFRCILCASTEHHATNCPLRGKRKNRCYGCGMGTLDGKGHNFMKKDQLCEFHGATLFLSFLKTADYKIGDRCIFKEANYPRPRDNRFVASITFDLWLTSEKRSDDPEKRVAPIVKLAPAIQAILLSRQEFIQSPPKKPRTML